MFCLTTQERQVLLFVSSLALLGLGINFLAKLFTRPAVIAAIYQDLGKVDLNSADSALLKDIPGIGDTLSSRIIEYHRENGGFKDVEELKNIKGISGSKYEKIREFLTVR